VAHRVSFWIVWWFVIVGVLRDYGLIFVGKFHSMMLKLDVKIFLSHMQRLNDSHLPERIKKRVHKVQDGEYVAKKKFVLC
jgi:hypothetical protein